MSTSKKSTTKSPAKPAKAAKKAGAKQATSKKAAKAGGGTSDKKATPAAPDAMTTDVVEFITAIDDYKRKNQRPFPNWSEVLEIVKALGYTRGQ